MRADELLFGELVQRSRETFRKPSAVHEDQRRAMRANELDELGMNGAPDRRGHRALRRGPAGLLDGFADLRHVLDGRLHRDREGLRSAGVDDRNVAKLHRGVVLELGVQSIR